MAASRMRIGDLPRDMREELFGLHATGVNPSAKESTFFARSVPVRDIDITRIDVSGYSAAQVASYAPGKCPPIVIAKGKLVDGGHRTRSAQIRGLTTLRAIDLTGIVDPDATGYVADLPKTSAAQLDREIAAIVKGR